jgi:hypothetical protein
MFLELGPVHRWREGDILMAANDWISTACVVTRDPVKVGTHDWHPFRDTQMFVEYFSPSAGAAWSDAKEDPAAYDALMRDYNRNRNAGR